MTNFIYQDMFPTGQDATEYRLLTEAHISTAAFDGQEVLKISSQGLTFLAEQAFKDVSHLLRPSHLKQLTGIFDDPHSSANDRYVALELLKNAVISAEGIFPMCQDTGTAIVIGKKGNGCGQIFRMKKPYQRESIMHIQRATCGIPRMRRWVCMRRKIPATIYRPRLNYMPLAATNTGFCLSPKVAVPPIKPICTRKPKPF
jgi:hypothetical protein